MQRLFIAMATATSCDPTFKLGSRLGDVTQDMTLADTEHNWASWKLLSVSMLFALMRKHKNESHKRSKTTAGAVFSPAYKPFMNSCMYWANWLSWIVCCFLSGTCRSISTPVKPLCSANTHLITNLSDNLNASNVRIQHFGAATLSCVQFFLNASLRYRCSFSFLPYFLRPRLINLKFRLFQSVFIHIFLSRNRNLKLSVSVSIVV